MLLHLPSRSLHRRWTSDAGLLAYRNFDDVFMINKLWGDKEMKRSDFIGKAGCGVAGVLAVGVARNSTAQTKRREFTFEIEVVEVVPDSHCRHRKGDRYKYPEELGAICPWLRDSMSGLLRVMENGGTLFWTYKDTPYEKLMDPEGVSTEFVRCPDPTRKGIVVKIIRTAVS